MSNEHIFYLSPDGNDGCSGAVPQAFASELGIGPWKSLHRAVTEIAKLRSCAETAANPVRIVLTAGVYRLESTVRLTEKEVGADGAPIRFEAFPGDMAVLDGGVDLTDWRREPEGLWSAPVPSELLERGLPRQLFVNGRRIPRARLPESGWFEAAGGISDADGRAYFHYRDNDINPEWAKQRDVDVIGINVWTDVRQRLVDVEQGRKLVRLAGGYPRSGIEPTLRYWVENVPEGLAFPNRWYLEREHRRVYYRPGLSETATEEMVAVIPMLPGLLELSGSPRQRLRNISFDGVAFAHSEWTQDCCETTGAQAAVHVNAAIEINHAENVRFDNCAFRNLGNYAVWFNRGCSGCRILHSEFADIGAGAVKIGESIEPTQDFQGDDTANLTRAITVDRCHIHHIGQVYAAAVGIIVFQSPDNVICGNHIHDTHYTGISVGWTWGYGHTLARNNDISRNHIHHIGQGLLGDMGAIYTLGMQPGARVCHNLIHDVRQALYGGNGIYADEGTSHVLFEGNTVRDVDGSCFQLHYGKDNIVRNNVFALAGEEVVHRTKDEPHLSLTFIRNTCISRSAPFFGANWMGNNYRVNHNRYIALKPELKREFASQTVSLGALPFHNSYLGVMPEMAPVNMRELPMFDETPSSLLAPAWESAHGFDAMVTKTGTPATGVFRTEFSLAKTEHDLLIRIHAVHSRPADGATGWHCDHAEIFVQPNLDNECVIQFMLNRKGESLLFSHPPTPDLPNLKFAAAIELTDTGWLGMLRIDLNGLAAIGGGSTPCWRFFYGRSAMVSPLSFMDWQALGNDRNGILDTC